MGVPRSLVRGALAASAVAAPLLVTAAPASAFELYSQSAILEHTFTDFAGDEVTCFVQYDSTLSRADSSTPFTADTSTQASTADPLQTEACRATVFVDTVYRDPAGIERHARAFGENFVVLELAEVQGTYQSSHRVVFLNCSANCQATYTTSPK